MTQPWLTPEEVPEVDELNPDDCWALLEASRIGRLAIRAGDGVDIFPVNFSVSDRQVFVRSAPGSKLTNIAHDSSVAFETDGNRRSSHWSVVIHGEAERLDSDEEIIESGIQELSTMTSSSKWNYIRITPRSISGRRFRAASR